MRSILIINYEYPPVGGGASNASYYFAKELAQAGNRICVVTMAFKKRRGHNREDGISVYRIGASRRKAGEASLLNMALFIVKAALVMPVVVKREKPECTLIFFGLPCGILGLPLRSVFNIPYIIMLRGGDVPGFEPSIDSVHRLLTPLRKKIYQKSSGVFANSSALADLSAKADPEFAVGIITNGVDCSFYRPCDKKRKGRDGTVFLFAGRMVAQKNVLALIDAFGKCCTLDGRCTLQLVGDGALKSSLKKDAERRGIAERIAWRTWLSKEELLCHLQQADCFVSPSINEGMSNALLEAMACGLTVIAGDCAGNRELITNDINGYVVATNSDALFTMMMRVIKEPGRVNGCGVHARIDCLQKHSWQQKSAELLQHIHGVIEDGRLKG